MIQTKILVNENQEAKTKAKMLNTPPTKPDLSGKVYC